MEPSIKIEDWGATEPVSKKKIRTEMSLSSTNSNKVSIERDSSGSKKNKQNQVPQNHARSLSRSIGNYSSLSKSSAESS